MEIDLDKLESYDDLEILAFRHFLYKEDLMIANEPYFLHQSPAYVYDVCFRKGIATYTLAEKSFPNAGIMEVLKWTKEMIERAKHDEVILKKYGYEKETLVYWSRKVNDQRTIMVTRLKDGALRSHLTGGSKVFESNVFPFPELELAILSTESKYFDLENISFMNENLRDQLLREKFHAE